MSKVAYEIELTLTPFEASVIARVLMDSVHWTGSGEFGAAARDIYAALSDLPGLGEANWTPKTGTTQDRMISRDWEESRE